MSRSVDLWIGKTDDEAVPTRVKLRIWEREGGRCWITHRKIRPGEAWDLDHRVALCNGGRHSEDNLAPALKDAHKAKTAEDVGIKAKTDRIRARHLGIKSPSRRKIPSRPFQKARPSSAKLNPGDSSRDDQPSNPALSKALGDPA
jgi:5-methylcytosine-specific restriction protein A